MFSLLIEAQPRPLSGSVFLSGGRRENAGWHALNCPQTCSLHGHWPALNREWRGGGEGKTFHFAENHLRFSVRIVAGVIILAAHMRDDELVLVLLN